MEGIEMPDDEGDNEATIVSERTDEVRKRKINADCNFDTT